MLPPEVPYDGVHHGLLVLLIVIIAVLIGQMRRMGRPD